MDKYVIKGSKAETKSACDAELPISNKLTVVADVHTDTDAPVAKKRKTSCTRRYFIVYSVGH